MKLGLVKVPVAGSTLAVSSCQFATVGWLVLVALGAASPVRGAAPTLDHLYPVAVAAGATTPLTAIGKFDPWPPEVWTDAPGIVFCADSGVGKFRVTVDRDVPPGPHLIRLYNEQGATAPRFLIVAGGPQDAETEPNDEIGKAQTIVRWPASLNGRLDKNGDVDSYAVPLQAGQTLIAALEAYVLASPVDAVLRLVDARGLEVAFNHDHGRTFDPYLTWTAPAAGTYYLQVFGFAYPATADVRFTGSDSCVYRLHLSVGPQVRYTLPLGLPSAAAKVRVFGWNLGPISGQEFEIPHTETSGELRTSWRRQEFENAVSLPRSEGLEWLEADFKARAADVADPTPPYAVTGCIETVDEEDRYRFSAAKGDRLSLAVESATLGFPLDPWLVIQDGAGKELVRNDDTTNPDPVLEWTAPEDGSYVAVVGSVLHRAGSDHLYRLSIRRAPPSFEAVVTEAGFILAPGKSVDIKVTPKRSHGHAAKLTATVMGLPTGITAAGGELGEKDKELSLKLTAAGDTRPFSGPIEIVFEEEGTGGQYRGKFELVSSSQRNGVPRGFRELVIKSTDTLWLTVTSAPPPPPVAEEESP